MVGHDLIAQVATAHGEAALAVVRVSGPGAHELVRRVFRSPRPPAPRVATLGSIVRPADGWVIDEALVTLFAEGASYTGEAMAEISCHGGGWVVREVLALLCAEGARPAGPGEFTKRAFLAGRLDLAQAEAVCALIRAKSEAAARASVRQLHGELSRRIAPPREAIVQLAAEIEATLDYPEEDTGALTSPEVAERAAPLLESLLSLLAEAPVGRAVRDGVTVALVGRPNTGKSSLLNALLGRDRAIVTETPGTTRDTLEEWTECGGTPVRLVDTAGLRRAAGDEVERLGLERANRAIEEADALVAVFDASEEPREDDRRLLRMLAEGRRLWIACLNKTDLPRVLGAAALGEEGRTAAATVETCALSARGVGPLRRALEAILRGGAVAPEEVLLTSERHAHAVRAAVEALEGVALGGPAGVPVDLLSLDLREAAARLDSITGRATTADVLEAIFATFCLGK